MFFKNIDRVGKLVDFGFFSEMVWAGFMNGLMVLDCWANWAFVFIHWTSYKLGLVMSLVHNHRDQICKY